MLKHVLMFALTSTLTFPALARISNNPNINEAPIESLDCSQNPQACRTVNSFDELKRLCQVYPTAPSPDGRQLPPTRFEYQCKVCWTEWQKEKPADVELPTYFSNQSRLLTNKGVIGVKPHSEPQQSDSLYCSKAREYIYQIDEYFPFMLVGDSDSKDPNQFDCQTVLSFKSEQEFHSYFTQKFCNKQVIQEQLALTGAPTGREVDLCRNPSIQSNTTDQAFKYCPNTEHLIKATANAVPARDTARVNANSRRVTSRR